MSTSGPSSFRAPVPWPDVVAMFKTTSEPNPAEFLIPSASEIAANTTLEQDKETVLAVWLVLGGDEDILRRKYLVGYPLILIDYKWKMRDEPSDDVSEWLGVTVEGGRVSRLIWWHMGLSGTIPTEIGALSTLRRLYLYDNNEL